jgi:chromosome partitioning protein
MTDNVSRGTTLPRPVETRILTVANQKGGVGKTTTTVNLAAALAQGGLHVLVIDLDPQGNASTALDIPHHAGIDDIFRVLVDGLPMDEVVQQVPHTPNLWCLPASINAAGAEVLLAPALAREFRLQRALQKYLTDHEAKHGRRLDYVLIDCPPSLGLLTVNAFVAAKEVLVPIQCEYYALEGVTQLRATIGLIVDGLNPGLYISTVLMTMYDGRTKLAQDVVDAVRQAFGKGVLETLIPRSVRLSEAPGNHQTVLNYDPTSPGAVAYRTAAEELAYRDPKNPELTRPVSTPSAPAAPTTEPAQEPVEVL